MFLCKIMKTKTVKAIYFKEFFFRNKHHEKILQLAVMIMIFIFIVPQTNNRLVYLFFVCRVQLNYFMFTCENNPITMKFHQNVYPRMKIHSYSIQRS